MSGQPNRDAQGEARSVRNTGISVPVVFGLPHPPSTPPWFTNLEALQTTPSWVFMEAS